MGVSDKKKILVIDDDVDIQKLLALKLRKQGYDVITASDGATGLTLLEQELPDMVMVDVAMPGMDGFEFCQHAKRLLQFRYFPIMVMTAYADDESVHHAYESGATDFVTKPINQAKLVHRIRFALKASATAARLAEREQLLLSAQKTARMGEWTYDMESREFYCSAEAAQLFGLPHQACSDVEMLLALITDNNRERVSDVFNQPSDKDRGYSLEFNITTLKGESRRIRQTADIVSNQHHHKCLVGVFQDMTELREAEKKARNLAMYDSLTGLPNRTFFLRMLNKTLASARRRRHSFALINLNIDNFMRINANLGHAAGDKILIEISERLADTMRQSELLSLDFSSKNTGDVMLGHLGADKFAIVLHEIDNCDAVAEVIRQLIEELNHNLVVDGSHIHLSVSIGISIYPDDATTANDLLKTTSQALAHAKELGPNKHSSSYFSREMNERSLQRLQIENQLVRALEKDEFMLYYQPKINLADNSVAGAEALIRWENAELGTVAPERFVTIAENRGLIEKITDWVIGETCRQFSEWESGSFHLPSIAINLESTVLLQPSFCDYLVEKLASARIDLSRLDFEITESTLMDHVDVVLPILKELKRLGSSISIDDFGTGYSSLSYLTSLPVSSMKIDKSFMRNVMHKEEDAVIVNAVISLAHSLGKTVIAEGVEDEEQLRFLRQRKCDVVQGYYYSQPLPATDFMAWCKAHEECQHKTGRIKLVDS